MPFQFSLASVLRLRESIEKREEVALKMVQLEVSRVRRRIDELTDEMKMAWEEREKALQTPTQAAHLHVLQAEINAAEEAEKVLNETLETLKQQRDVQMKNYTVARSERQMLTNLFAEKKSVYEQEQARRQQKSLDDIVAARWQRS